MSRPEFVPVRTAALQAGLVALAFIAFFAHFIYTQGRISLHPDWSHAYLVPLIAGYYIYENRQRIFCEPISRNWLGLPIMLAGMAIYFFFTLGPTWNHSFQGVGMVISLLGMTLFLFGTKMWSALLFPQLYLLLAIRAPHRIMLTVTPTLQVWASQGSYYLLNVLGYETERSGTVLTVYHKGEVLPLNVAEACSGMRMIVGFIALGIAVAFLACPRWWQRVILIASAIPVGIGVNVLRVTTLGVLSTIDPSWAAGQAHLYVGMLWLIPAFVVYMGLAWVLQRIFIEVPAEGGRGSGVGEKASRHQGIKASRSGTGVPPVHGRDARATDASVPRCLDGSPPVLPWRPVITVTAILLIGLAAFHSAKAAMRVVLYKEAVPLRRPLSDLPTTMGRWRSVAPDAVLSPEIVDELGTDQYLSRQYSIDGNPANGVLLLDVTYYTGGIDAVPHIPERCFVGGGLDKAPLSTIIVLQIHRDLWWVDPELDPGEPGGGYLMAQSRSAGRQVVRMPHLPPSGLGLNTSEYWDRRDPEHTLAAGYFFIANGAVEATAEGVRLRAFSRSTRYAYYCKVQLTYQHPTRPVTRHDLGEAAGDFVNDLLPELMLCLPDWSEVERKGVRAAK